MDRKERIEMDLAILEAAREILAVADGSSLTFEEIHKRIKSKMPYRFQGGEAWRTDYDALYDAEERFFASGEYKDTSRNRSLFSAGWSAAKDHYKLPEIDVNSPKYLAAQAEISDRLDEADLRKAEECRQSLQAENDRLYRDLANLKAQLQMANEKIRSMMQ